MTDQEYRDAIQNVIYLAGCAVNGATPDAGRARAMNLEHLYNAAEHHQLRAIVAMALESAGVHDKAFIQAMGKAIRRQAVMDADMAVLFGALDRAGIWYMPLKGAVLKEDYPACGMREMSDRDILFDAARADDVKAILEGMGFSCETFGKGVHDVYHKPPVSSFEMHRALFNAAHGQKLDDYYRSVEARLLRGPGCSRRFSGEDFYIYFTAHECKHYFNGGTGLRSILDTFVYLREYEAELDWEYIAQEVKKLGIDGFERQNRSLALHLFGGDALTPEDEAMLEYIAGSGAYGNRRYFVGNHVRKLGGGRQGKLKYLLRRIFLPMENVKSSYPFFYRHKILLPALYAWRVLKGLTTGRKAAAAELKALMRRGRESQSD